MFFQVLVDLTEPTIAQKAHKILAPKRNQIRFQHLRKTIIINWPHLTFYLIPALLCSTPAFLLIKIK